MQLRDAHVCAFYVGASPCSSRLAASRVLNTNWLNFVSVLTHALAPKCALAEKKPRQSRGFCRTNTLALLLGAAVRRGVGIAFGDAARHDGRVAVPNDALAINGSARVGDERDRGLTVAAAAGQLTF